MKKMDEIEIKKAGGFPIDKPTAYCRACYLQGKGNMQGILNPEIKKTLRGIALQGNCINCGRKIMKFISKEEAQKYPQEKQMPIQVSPLPIQTIPFTEKERIEKFKEDVKNNELLKKNGIKVVSSKWQIFLGSMIILFFVLFLIAFWIFLEGYYSGKSAPINNLNPVLNSTQECYYNNTLICEKQECNCNVTQSCIFPSVINVIVNNTNNTI